MRERVETTCGAGREFHRSHGDERRGAKASPCRSIPRASEALSGLSVVVPAYNEEERLGASLTRIWNYLSGRFPAFELIVVDDGSTDATARVVAEFAANHQSVELITYQPNRGRDTRSEPGSSAPSFDPVLFSDADLATPIEELDALLERIRAGADVAIGSRMVAGSGARGPPAPVSRSWPGGASICWPSGWPRPGSSIPSAASSCSTVRWRATYSTG